MITNYNDIPIDKDVAPLDERDWKAETIYGNTFYPSSLDLRPRLNKIRNQGNQGACVAFSVAVMKEWQENKEVNFQDYMSPQFIYNLRSYSGEGMYIQDAFKILLNIGIVPEKDFEYNTKTEIPSEVKISAKNYKIKSYARVSTIEALKQALYTNGPCTISVPVYNRGKRMWRATYYNQKPEGYHCMAVVGYNKEGFIIRNSWGVLWGNSGYTIFPYTDWGIQTSIFTSIDDKSYYKPPQPRPKPFKDCCRLS